MLKRVAIALFVIALIALGFVFSRMATLRAPTGAPLPVRTATPAEPTATSLQTSTPLPTRTPTKAPTSPPRDYRGTRPAHSTTTPKPASAAETKTATEEKPEEKPEAKTEPAQLVDVSAQLEDKIETIDSPEGTVLIIDSTVLFAFGSAELADSALETLDSIAKTILEPGQAIRVEGHTDSKGNPERNLELSLERANAVKEALRNSGFEGSIKVEGHGQTTPREPNKHQDGTDNPEGRAKNRRVEITLLNK